MLLTVAVSFVLITTCFVMHYMVLQVLTRLLNRARMWSEHPVLLVTCTLFAVHLVQVLAFALGLAWLDGMGQGRLVGAIIGGPGWLFDHFYFSLAAFTTLGLGDILPQGPIRLLAGLEPLCGMVLITWSASFIYLVMDRYSGGKRRLDVD